MSSPSPSTRAVSWSLGIFGGDGYIVGPLRVSLCNGGASAMTDEAQAPGDSGR